MHPRLRTWLQLLRAPNLFTVAGDPIAGFMLANFGIPTGAMFPVMGASLCFYGAGLLDNDLADLAEDRLERPKRPLPSGAAKPAQVLVAMLGLSAIGLLLCALAGPFSVGVGAGLIVAMGLYNHGSKRVPFIGALNMGLCRSLSLILGASAAGAQQVPGEAVVAAITIGLFIAAVTNLARFETRAASSPRWAKWMPAALIFAATLAIWNWLPMGTQPASTLGSFALRGLFLGATLSALAIGAGLCGPSPIPPAIGKFIRLLILLQAALCAHTGLFGLILAALLLLLWPLSRAVSKRFYAS